jgi:hypothetical protein
METEKSSQTSNYYEPSNRYMIDTRKHYLLASNKDSLESLLKNQSEQLRKVLMDLKAEYDLIIRESTFKKKIIEEYNKKINMLQKADSTLEKKQEEKKELTANLQEGLEINKNKKTKKYIVNKLFQNRSINYPRIYYSFKKV